MLSSWKQEQDKEFYQPHIYQFNIVLEVLANTQNTFLHYLQKMIEKEKKKSHQLNIPVHVENWKNVHKFLNVRRKF